LVCLGVLIALYAVLVVTLAALGRRGDARAIARFVPDCAVLLGRLVRDPDLPWRRRLVLVLVAGYLAMPIDLVPDFLPVIGYLDDAIVVIVTLRWLLSRVGPDRLRAHWPGPVSSFRVVLRLAGAPRSSLSR
jgi:uncharacterized membrane protein YkvA (DUF1232 family)